MAIERLMQLLAPRDGKAPLTSNKYLSLKGEDTFVAKKDGNRFLAWFRGRDEKNRAAVEFVKREIDGELGDGFGATILKALGIGNNRMTGQALDQALKIAENLANARKAGKPGPSEKQVAQMRTAPDVPAPDVPAPDAPGSDVPAPDVPGPDVPAPDVPAPDVPAPDVPAPDVPARNSLLHPADPPSLRDLEPPEKQRGSWWIKPGVLLRPSLAQVPDPLSPLIPSQMTYEFSDKSRVDCTKEWNERPEQTEGASALIPGITVVGLIKNEVWPQNGIPPLQFIKELTGNNSDIMVRLNPMLTKGFLDHLELYLPTQVQAASYRFQPEFSTGTLNIIKEPNNQYRAQLNLVQPIERAFGKAMDPRKSYREFSAEFLVNGKEFSITKGPEVAIQLQPAGSGQPRN